MSLTVTRYDNGDAGIPDLVGQPNSLISILDATILPLGWTKPFSSDGVAVYKNSVDDGGTGVHVRVDDSGAQHATVQVFSEMIDVNSGLNGSTSFTRVGIWKSSTTDTTPREYVVVADGLTFWIYTPWNGHQTRESRRGSGFLGFGDLGIGEGSFGFNYFSMGTDTEGQNLQVGWLNQISQISSEQRAICGPLDGYGPSGLMMLRPLYANLTDTGTNTGGLKKNLPTSLRKGFYGPDVSSPGHAYYFGPPRGLYFPSMQTDLPVKTIFPESDLLCCGLIVNIGSALEGSHTDVFIDTKGPW